jgi:tRNA-dihydrouridine synthase A
VTANRHTFSVAPMMDWTDRHCRVFHRLLTRHAVLYTEMVTAPAIIRGDRERLLGFDPSEHPVVLQLGGCNPTELAEAASVGAAYGYDEINLNVGCPSDRVQSGRFGACLMAEPELVANCVRAMRDAVSIPVTVKCRIGIDDMDDDAGLTTFVDHVADAGCQHVIVHARKAWLSGLSPKENREIPPLNYDRVYRLKAARPDLTISINGGFTDLDACSAALAHVDGVMVGRAAYQTPYLLSDVDRALYGDQTAVPPERIAILQRLRPYVARHLEAGGRLNNITRHILGLFHGQPRARAFRRFISENATGDSAGLDVYDQALAIAAGEVRYAA